MVLGMAMWARNCFKKKVIGVIGARFYYGLMALIVVWACVRVQVAAKGLFVQFRIGHWGSPHPPLRDQGVHQDSHNQQQHSQELL